MFFDASFWSFLVAITLLTMSPGVDTLLVIRNTTRGGMRDGILTSLAICCGLFVHAAVSALGISIILLQSAWAFGLLKLAGAAYLVWLGLKSLDSARRGARFPVAGVLGVRQRVPVSVSLREGFLSNVLNPKTVVFYMAFLPQFIAPSDPPLIKSLWLAGIHFLIANAWQIAIAAMVGSAGRWLAKRWVSRSLDSFTGMMMIAFGIKLALSQRP